MRFCRGFICFLNSEIRLECALFVPYRPKKCFTRRPDAHIFSGKQAIKKRTCRRPLKCCSQAVSTARKVLCTSCIASRYCDYVPENSKHPMQTVMRFSRCGAGFGNKKSPHNSLNLTIPSGMALVRVRYVAIRKSKTCSGSFGSRAGTLSKYVILNCWNRLPHKSSRVNVNLSGRGSSILLRKTVLSLKSPTGAFIAALRCANANF